MGAAVFEVAVPGHFRLDLTVWALRRRGHNDLDRFDGTCYRRVVTAAGRVVELAVHQEGPARRPSLVVEVGTRGRLPSAATLAEVAALVHRMLGLDADLAAFYRLAGADPRLEELAARFKGMRPPRFPSVFEALVNAVACQQLSLTVGIHLLNRLGAHYGPRFSAANAGPAGFPSPERLAAADPTDLRALGFSGSKARTVVGLARRVTSGDLDLEVLADADDATARASLMGIAGIGRWSAEYTLLRGLGRLEVLPGDDVGARNNLARRFELPPTAGYADLAALGATWWPYGGLVYFHLLLDALERGGELDAPGPPPARQARVQVRPSQAGRPR